MSKLLLLALTASGVTLKRFRQPVPRLQHEEVYDSDFVHDDTEHPDEAVKMNIEESKNRLGEAEAAYKAIESKLESANKAYGQYEPEILKHQAEVAHAEEQVHIANASANGLPVFEANLTAAEEALASAKDALNQSNIAAQDAAEGVNEARHIFHKKNLLEVEAKENITDEEDNLAEWHVKAEDGKSANVSLAEWQQKLNVSLSDDAEFEAKAKAAEAEYAKIRTDYEKAEIHYSESQKLFTVDKETYEEHNGPYYGQEYGVGNDKEEEDKSLWDMFKGIFR